MKKTLTSKNGVTLKKKKKSENTECSCNVLLLSEPTGYTYYYPIEIVYLPYGITNLPIPDTFIRQLKQNPMARKMKVANVLAASKYDYQVLHIKSRSTPSTLLLMSTSNF